MRPPAKYPGDAAIKKMLEKYGCPTPFHVVRMRFLGAIASPAAGVGPAKAVKELWPGEGVPVFDSQREAEVFFGAMMFL